MRIDLYIHQDDSRIDRILEIVQRISKGQDTMSQELDDLTADVKANADVEASAVLLIKGIAAKLDAAKTDPAALAALSASLKASAAALADAITANTPAEDASA